MSATARAWCLAAALCALVVAADQIAKAIVEAQLVIGEEVDLLGPFGLTLAHNRGVAFGLAGGAGLPLVVIPLLALGVVVYLFARDPGRPWMWVAIGLLAGGAIGNLIDRVQADGHRLHRRPPWPPFNLADVAITAGVVLLVLIYLREERARADG